MKLGVFGGTFDPPHIGHVIVAQDALHRLGLERVLFIPAATPPHKRDRTVTAGASRRMMLEAALGDDPRFEISDIELRRSGASFTVETLRQLAEERPADELYFLLGADQFRELATWKEPQEVSRLARLVVLSREAADITRLPGIDHLEVSVTRIDVSSTEVRRRVKAGEPIRYLVAPAVEALIRAEGLYR